jgi:hypothetical protein
MSKYVIAYCSLHTGTLEQTIVEAESAYLAAAQFMQLDVELLQEYTTVEDLCDLAFDTDSFLSVIEI